MPKPKTGSVRERKTKDGRVVFFARVDYIDPSGKRRALTRKAPTRSDAKRMAAEMVREVEERLERDELGRTRRLTFDQYADEFTARYLVEPVYAGDKKIAGMRSAQSCRNYLKPLRAAFGRRLLSGIRYADIERYRNERMATETVRKRPRTVASMNRELGVMRRMFTIAVRDGLVKSNPFHAGDPLITIAHEVTRDRILTREEEARLLDACYAVRRPALRPLVVCALATGMRLGEIMKLEWRDVDFAAGTVTVRALNCKTLKTRKIGMTQRLRAELIALARTNPGPSERVFRCASFPHVWILARAAAGLEGLRFHDLRHTFATRLVRQGAPLAQVGRILGHSSPTMTYRYVAADADDIASAAALLDADDEREARREAGGPVSRGRS